MPVLQLSQGFVKTCASPPNTGKVDYHDSSCKGLMLEVRGGGGKTWYLRYKDTRGKQRQLRLADARDISLAQARALADKTRAEIAMGNDPVAKKAEIKATPTFEKFARESYIPFVKAYKRSWDSDESLIRNHLLPKLGKKHLDEITKLDIIAIHHGRKAAGAAAGSANRLLILMRYMFNLAIRWEVPGITKNPSAGVALLEENNKREQFISVEEAQRLYAAVETSDNTQLKYIVPMLILTGARKREALDGKWEDFDLSRRMWRIPTCKTGKPRHVPLSEGVLKLLAMVPRFPDCSWVFPNPKTLKPFVSIFYSWNTARKQAGLKDVRMHDLRHSFASFLVNNGRSLYEVQKLLGHTQVKTTQRYAHLKTETLLEAVDTVSLAITPMPFAMTVNSLGAPQNSEIKAG